MHGQHDRVPGRVRVDGRLRAEHVRFHGTGHGRTAGAAQLRAGVLHAGGDQPAGADGLRRDRVAGVRPEPGPAVRVAHRRRFHRARPRPAADRGSVGRLLLRRRGPTPVRDGRTCEYADEAGI